MDQTGDPDLGHSAGRQLRGRGGLGGPRGGGTRRQCGHPAGPNYHCWRQPGGGVVQHCAHTGRSRGPELPGVLGRHAA
eukprot:8508538-Lingulodinium_polyedra.AAC.1